MKILIVDDSQDNIKAALLQLAGHDLTTAASYDNALLKIKGTGTGSKNAPEPFPYDVVLLDLLMPASADQQGPDGTKYVGQEMPVGIFLGLLAAKAGAARVAVFTDSDHHSHPASACFDSFNRSEQKPIPLNVNGAKLYLCNNRNWVGQFRPDDLSVEMPSNEFLDKKYGGQGLPSVRAKKWGELLEYIEND